jgi:phage shock protein A
MTTFNRFSDIISSNINTITEKVCDPVKISKLMTQDMQETLLELKASLAKVLTDKKNLEWKLRENLDRKNDFEEKALMAINREREDLAKKILERVMALEKDSERIQCRLTETNRFIEGYRLGIDKLEAKIGESRVKSKLAEERLKMAQNHKKVRSMILKSNLEGTDLRIEKLEQQIDCLGSEPGVIQFSVELSLEEEITQLEHTREIQMRLKTLKKNSQKHSSDLF